MFSLLRKFLSHQKILSESVPETGDDAGPRQVI